MSTIQNVGVSITGIVFGFVLFVIPDILINFGEGVSTGIKAVLVVALLIAGIVAVRAKKSGTGIFLLSSCAALTFLVLFGGTIRLAELGIL